MTQGTPAPHNASKRNHLFEIGLIGLFLLATTALAVGLWTETHRPDDKTETTASTSEPYKLPSFVPSVWITAP